LWVACSVAANVTLLPPTTELDESVSGALPEKQASLAFGVEVLTVTGVLLAPLKQPVLQIVWSVQLFCVPRGPPMQL